MAWDGDLARGDAWEAEAARLLNLSQPDCNFHKHQEGYFTPFDLICEHCLVTIECKLDDAAAKTGNLCFEENMFKHTKADFLLYKSAYGIFLACPKPLYRVLKGLLVSEHPDVQKIRGGDGNRQILYLARLNTLTATGYVWPFDLRVIGTHRLPQL